MFTEADVKTLSNDRRLAPPVLSLYVNTDRGHPEGEKFLASFRHLVHQADRLLQPRTNAESALARERLTQALPELLEFLDTEVAPQPVVRGAAMFVSLAEAADHDPRTPAFTAFTLPRPLRNQCAIDRQPSIRPLLFLLDQYERVGIIVADRTHARIFTLFLGELESVERRTADTPQHHRQGGWKQMLFQRDIEGHLKAHIRSTVRRAVNVFGAHPLKRIVLGGTDDTLGLMKRELPQRLQSSVVGTFIAESHASDTETLARALAIAQAAEAREEEERVERLSDALADRPRLGTWSSTGKPVAPERPATPAEASPPSPRLRRAPASPSSTGELGGSPGEGGWNRGERRAVQGATDTLRALSERRVQLLLLRRGLHVPGSACDNCESLFAAAGGLCPYCKSLLRAVPDVLERAVERAQAEHAEVEFVTESPALEALGGIGALLRF